MSEIQAIRLLRQALGIAAYYRDYFPKGKAQRELTVSRWAMGASTSQLSRVEGLSGSHGAIDLTLGHVLRGHESSWG